MHLLGTGTANGNCDGARFVDGHSTYVSPESLDAHKRSCLRAGYGFSNVQCGGKVKLHSIVAIYKSIKTDLSFTSCVIFLSKPTVGPEHHPW